MASVTTKLSTMHAVLDELALQQEGDENRHGYEELDQIKRRCHDQQEGHSCPQTLPLGV